MTAAETGAQEKSTPVQTQPQVEKQTNCPACNKPIKKIRKYYRDGKYYCNKRCWLKLRQKNKGEPKE